MAARCMYYRIVLKEYYIYPCLDEEEWGLTALIVFVLSLIIYGLATIIYFAYAPAIQLAGYIMHTSISTAHGTWQFIIDAGVFLSTLTYQWVSTVYSMSVELLLSMPETVRAGLLCALAGFVWGFICGDKYQAKMKGRLVDKMEDLSSKNQSLSNEVEMLRADISRLRRKDRFRGRAWRGR